MRMVSAFLGFILAFAVGISLAQAGQKFSCTDQEWQYYGKDAHRVCLSDAEHPPRPRKDRGTKFSIGWMSNFTRSGANLQGLEVPYNGDNTPFTVALRAGLEAYTQSRGGRGLDVDFNPEGGADAYVLSGNPSAFVVGDRISLFTGRTATFESGEIPSGFFEVRPRLYQRLRFGIGFGWSRSFAVKTTSYDDAVTVSNVVVRPWSSEETLVDLGLLRSFKTEEQFLQVWAWFVNLGPEIDLINTDWVDFSVEGGAMFWRTTAWSKRNTREDAYEVFAPEVYTPSLDPRKFLVGYKESEHGATDFRQTRAQGYLGARLEVYPLRNLGVSTGVRWHSSELPWSAATIDSFLGPIQIHQRARRVTFLVSLVYAN